MIRDRLRDATVLVFLGMSSVAVAAEHPIFVVRRATIVAFFPAITQKELEADPESNEALADFQYYAKAVREPIRKSGIDFHEVYASSFRIRIGTKVVTFRPSDTDVGYYFIVSGKKPRIEYGVATASDLLQMATEYFGFVAK